MAASLRLHSVGYNSASTFSVSFTRHVRCRGVASAECRALVQPSQMNRPAFHGLYGSRDRRELKDRIRNNGVLAQRPEERTRHRVGG